jgi:hypothetical protein
MNTQTTPDEIALTRWLDGDMDATELAAFEAQLAVDPTLCEEATAMKELSTALQAEFPRIAEVPHADFFNSQIQERIAQLDSDIRRSVERNAAPPFWLNWLRMPWLAGAAIAALVAVIAITDNHREEHASTVLSTYAPNTAIKPRAFHSDAANATVLMLDGLENIPADRIIIGYQVDHSDTKQELAMTTLYSAKGDVLMVLDVDGLSQPRVIARQ